MNIEINLKEEISKAVHDQIGGGLADDKTVRDIANKWSAPIELINLMLKWGVDVEMEHTDDRNIAMEIALDHLMEDPLYYKRLKEMEDDAKEELSNDHTER